MFKTSLGSDQNSEIVSELYSIPDEIQIAPPSGIHLFCSTSTFPAISLSFGLLSSVFCLKKANKSSEKKLSRQMVSHNPERWTHWWESHPPAKQAHSFENTHTHTTHPHISDHFCSVPNLAISFHCALLVIFVQLRTHTRTLLSSRFFFSFQKSEHTFLTADSAAGIIICKTTSQSLHTLLQHWMRCRMRGYSSEQQQIAFLWVRPLFHVAVDTTRRRYMRHARPRNRRIFCPHSSDEFVVSFTASHYLRLNVQSDGGRSLLLLSIHLPSTAFWSACLRACVFSKL